MHEAEPIYESSGNVFADLDLPEPEEALAKAEHARRIGGIIKSRRLNRWTS